MRVLFSYDYENFDICYNESQYVTNNFINEQNNIFGGITLIYYSEVAKREIVSDNINEVKQVNNVNDNFDDIIENYENIEKIEYVSENFY